MINLAYASWIHGTATQIQAPEDLVSIQRTGGGIYIEGYNRPDAVFHFPIPTPVIVNDQRLRVGSVMLQFETGSSDAAVVEIDINDGKTNIHQYLPNRGLPRDGLSGSVGLLRLEVPEHATVRLGLDLVVHVKFGIEGMDHSVHFEAAGCEFLPS
jgi:hypothetical protein